MISYFETKSSGKTLRGMVHTGTKEIPIIMVHGFFSSNRVGPYRLYMQIAERLNALGYTVFRFDLSGMGESDGSSDCIEFKTHVNDLNHVVHYVCQRCNTKSVHLLAHCIGCCVATESAIACQDMVRTITFISPFMPTDDNYRRLIGPDEFEQLAHSNTFTRKPMICQKSYIDAGSVITNPENIRAICEKDLLVLISGKDEFSSVDDYMDWTLTYNIHHRFIPHANHNYLDYGAREKLFSALEQRFSAYLAQKVCSSKHQKTAFFFVRHAESKKNKKEITGGDGEPLTDCGVKQIDDLINTTLIKLYHPKLEIRTNKIVQVHETARILSERLNLSYSIDPNLRPADMGVINGLSHKQVLEEYPEIAHRMDQWRAGEIEACELDVPGMKSPEAYWEEMERYLYSLCDGIPKIIVCSRSIMVWAHNLVNGKTPFLGGGYKHVPIENCEMIPFIYCPVSHTCVSVKADISLTGN